MASDFGHGRVGSPLLPGGANPVILRVVTLGYSERNGSVSAVTLSDSERNRSVSAVTLSDSEPTRGLTRTATP